MIKIGNQYVTTSLKGYFDSEVEKVMRGEEAKLKGGIKKPTITITYGLDVNGSKFLKDKTYIATTIEGSELRAVIDELLPEVDTEEAIDLEDLVGLECQVKVVHNTSRRGNIFENIGKVIKRGGSVND